MFAHPRIQCVVVSDRSLLVSSLPPHITSASITSAPSPAQRRNMLYASAYPAEYRFVRSSAMPMSSGDACPAPACMPGCLVQHYDYSTTVDHTVLRLEASLQRGPKRFAASTSAIRGGLGIGVIGVMLFVAWTWRIRSSSCPALCSRDADIQIGSPYRRTEIR